jgi:hypothetical protein
MVGNLAVGDVVWVGATSCGYKATVLIPPAAWEDTRSPMVRDGYFVRTEDGKEFWCPTYAMREFSPLDILASQ